MSEMIPARDDDDPGFLALTERMTDFLEDEGIRALDHLVVIRVKNWFDHKWFGFSGIGIVPFFGDGGMRHPGVAKDEFRSTALTFPPFTPWRIVAEDTWVLSPKTPPLRRKVHPRVLRASADNLHRRIKDYSNSMVAVWIATNSKSNARGSFMAYRSNEGSVTGWYASFCRHGSEWRLDQVKGIGREAVASMIEPRSDQTSQCGCCAPS